MLYDNLKFIPEGIDPKNTSKALFICHPGDFGKYFKTVSDEILATANAISGKVSIWYFEEIEKLSDFSEDELKSLFMQMNFIVVPVTGNLLKTENTAQDVFVSYAKRNNIPILPLMQEDGLEELYSLPEKFGNIQFLKKNQNDLTAISYEKKLEDYLSYTVVGNETRKRVQKEFQAYIFLSYRKKDRASASNVMAELHSIDNFRDIAVWYDEFLVPGEDFNESIKKALTKGDIFVMAVTPNITEMGNYIILHEYPAAKKLKRKILPIECIETDRKMLKNVFRGIPECVKISDKEKLEKEISEKIGTDSAKENTPEHLYLMGLAYLNGIDVEINYEKAIALLTRAAEENCPEAMLKLSDVYRTGIGTPIDYEKAIFYIEAIIGYYKNRLDENEKENYSKLFGALFCRQALALQSSLPWEEISRASKEAYNFYKTNYNYIDTERYLGSFILCCIVCSSATANAANKTTSLGSVLNNIKKSDFTESLQYLEDAEKELEKRDLINNPQYQGIIALLYSSFMEIFSLADNKEKLLEYLQKQMSISGKNEGIGEMLTNLLNRLNQAEMFSDENDALEYFAGILQLMESGMNTVADKIQKNISLLSFSVSMLLILSLIQQNYPDSPAVQQKMVPMITKILGFAREIPLKKHANFSLNVYSEFLRLLFRTSNNMAEKKALARENAEVLKVIKSNMPSEAAEEQIINNFTALAAIELKENNPKAACRYLFYAKKELNDFVETYDASEFEEAKLFYCKQIATILYFVFSLSMKTGRLNKAANAINECCEVYRTLYEKTNDEVFLVRYLMQLPMLCYFYDRINKTEKAAQLLEDGINKNLALLQNNNPAIDEYREELSDNLTDAYYMLGGFLYKLNKAKKAAVCFNNFLRLAKGGNRPDQEIGALITLFRIRRENENDDLSQSLNLLVTAVDRTEKLLDTNPAMLDEYALLSSTILLDYADECAKINSSGTSYLLSIAKKVFEHFISLGDASEELQSLIEQTDKKRREINNCAD